MSEPGKRLIEGVKQALKYARGACDHDWKYEDTYGKKHEVKTCGKCGVRVTNYGTGK